MPEHLSSFELKCSAAALRDFLELTANIPQISDPELELKVLEAPERVKHGAEIEFRISAYGFKQRMRHRYTEVSVTDIVAEQVDGPTRKWVHRQTVVSLDDTSCTLTDHIEFEPPGGMLGFVMTEQAIRESIEDGMEFRYRSLDEMLSP